MREETLPYVVETSRRGETPHPMEPSDYVETPRRGVSTAQFGEESGIYGQQAVYLAPLYYSEVGAAERLRSLARAIPSRLSDLPPAFITLDPQLSPQQAEAIRRRTEPPAQRAHRRSGHR